MIEVNWDNEDRKIVVWKFSRGWTWQEFFDAKSKVDHMIDEVDGIVDSIFITSKDKLLPAGAITHFRKIISTRHDRHDLIVIVGPNIGKSPTLLTSVLNMMVKFVPGIPLHYVDNVPEAYGLIESLQQKRL